MIYVILILVQKFSNRGEFKARQAKIALV